MEKKIIQVTAKEWFDKINGNSYFSAKIWLDDELIAVLPMQYGYSDTYKYESTAKLKELGILKSSSPHCSQIEKDNNVKFLFTKHENCKKKDVEVYGER